MDRQVARRECHAPARLLALLLSPAPHSEQSQSALGSIGRAQREPSLSPNQQTFSIGSPSPLTGSDIEKEIVGARPTPFQPKVGNVWASAEPPPLQRAAVFATDTRSATGEPELSAGAGVRLASSAQQAFVDVEGRILSQPCLALPVFDMSRQSGYQHVDIGAVQPVFAAERQSGAAITLGDAARQLPAPVVTELDDAARHPPAFTAPAPACAAQFAAERPPGAPTTFRMCRIVLYAV